MFLFNYWSFWNYNWYLCSELGLVPLNGPLKMSIINTSIIGGLMTYVYPKKIVVRDKNIVIKDKNLKIVDFLFHQIPLIRLYFSSQISNLCGLYYSIPVSLWIAYLQLLHIDKNKIYKIKFNHLIIFSVTISSFIGLLHHNHSLLYRLYM